MEDSIRPPPASKKRGSWKRRFLGALARCGNVTLAARKAKVATSTVYEARLRDPRFAAAVAKAREAAVETLEDKAQAIAKDGNAQMLMFLLKAHRPGRYRDGAADADGPPVNPEQIDGRLLARRVLESAEARTLACRLLALVAGGAEPGGACAPGDAGGVDPRPALEPPQ